jgi:hypothetical protein
MFTIQLPSQPALLTIDSSIQDLGSCRLLNVIPSVEHLIIVTKLIIIPHCPAPHIGIQPSLLHEIFLFTFAHLWFRHPVDIQFRRSWDLDSRLDLECEANVSVVPLGIRERLPVVPILPRHWIELPSIRHVTKPLIEGERLHWISVVERDERDRVGIILSLPSHRVVLPIIVPTPSTAYCSLCL